MTEGRYMVLLEGWAGRGILGEVVYGRVWCGHVHGGHLTVTVEARRRDQGLTSVGASFQIRSFE